MSCDAMRLTRRVADPKAAKKESNAVKGNKKAPQGSEKDQMGATSEPNGAKRSPEESQRAPKGHLRTTLVSEVAFGSSIGVFRASFWRHLADLKCHLGPSWAPKGFPKSHCWRKVRQKIEKGGIKKRCRKLHDFLMEF